jgi:hypothetical protein
VFARQEEERHRAGDMKEVGERLPEIVKAIYALVAELEAVAPGRRFTPDGHMVGSLGEVWAGYRYNLTLLPNSTAIHDAAAPDGRLVQVKTTQNMSVSTYEQQPDNLLVLKLMRDGRVEEWFNGPGTIAWRALGKKAKNGQCRLSLKALRALMSDVPEVSKLARVRE